MFVLLFCTRRPFLIYQELKQAEKLKEKKAFILFILALLLPPLHLPHVWFSNDPILHPHIGRRVSPLVLPTACLMQHVAVIQLTVEPNIVSTLYNINKSMTYFTLCLLNCKFSHYSSHRAQALLIALLTFADPTQSPRPVDTPKMTRMTCVVLVERYSCP